MRTFPSVNIGAFKHGNERQVVKAFSDALRQISGALARSVAAGQAPPANPPSSRVSSQYHAAASTAATAPAQGDTLLGAPDGTWTKIPIGSSGTLLTSDGSAAAWTAPALTTHNLLSSGHPDTVAAAAVRGDLVVANSTPAWTKLPIASSSGKFLKGGADPAWTAVAAADVGGLGALAVLNTVGAATIDNRTRSIWLPWTMWTDSATLLLGGAATSGGTFPAEYTASGLPDLVPVGLITETILPMDVAAGGATSWNLFYANASTSGNGVHFDFAGTAVADGGSLTAANTLDLTGTNGINATPPTTAHQLKVLTFSTSTVLTNPGVLLRLSLQRDPTHASDTNAGVMNFVGLRIDYNADS